MMTMNWQKRTHYRTQGTVIAKWRRATTATAAEQIWLPRFATVTIECWPYQAKGVLADTGAHTGVVKACVDGLRDAGILSDDTGKEILGIMMRPPQRGPNGVVLELTGQLASGQ